jgi:methyl halide transferase
MQAFDAQYWNDRYLSNNFPWDIGHVSQPLKAYIDQLKELLLHILIPGGGKGHELNYLCQLGYHNVQLIDWSEFAVQAIREQYPNIPTHQIIQADFFQWQGEYDLILEQTFFCALAPELRTDYVTQMAQLLKPGGKIVGVMFDFPLTEKGPPFGGDRMLYEQYFKPQFNILKTERCFNSEPERVGKELFIILQKKLL